MTTIREAYEGIGADYDGVVKRLMNDSLVERFAGKFLQDDSFPRLEAALSAGDGEEAFVAAHTLKGVCQNLGFDNLFGPASEITEALRGEADLNRARELFPQVKESYEATVTAIKSCVG